MAQGRAHQRISKPAHGPWEEGKRTFFAEKLRKKGFDNINVKTLVKPKTLDFELDYMVIPVNVAGVHWTCCVVDMKNKLIVYLDSMLVNNSGCVDRIEDYLKRLQQLKKDMPLEDWWVQFFPKDIPTQSNGYDCGVFVCTYMEYVTRGKVDFSRPDPGVGFDFSQREMKYLRKLICAEILEGKIFDRV
ncbi:SUMO1 sentrin specific peptidase 1 [Rhizophlyctis rosea]|uniref:SUMO1 sentrin specific peptidase 1 n=1 Tax=Rhizophlyctis rosea TaxID=64517 RepID=A0AAD5SD06_9FUNG|nr:SUMO1 sentrin specific peptidase 1 [Rhizophlyctis rosea]